MARPGYLVSWAAAAMAVPAAVTFAPVHPPEALSGMPQMVAVGDRATTPAGPAAAVRVVRRDRPAATIAHEGRPAIGPGAIAVQAALTRLGDPYEWAAAGPDAFDCSGLVVWSFQQAGVSLPHSSQELAAGGQPVPLDRMQPGDVITYYSNASHVGLYVGRGKMVHASTYGVPVAVVPIDNAPIYNVRRYR